MSEQLVSIMVPVYNAELYVKRCIESLVNQTYRNIEIILVNDGSTDSSLEIMQSVAKNDERIKVISTKNMGAGNARNRCIEESIGEYLMFVDADDWLDYDCIEKCMEIINRDKDIDCVLFPYIREYAANRRIQYTLGRHNVKYFFHSIQENFLLQRVIGLPDDSLQHPDSLNDINGSGCKLCAKRLFANVRYPAKDVIVLGEDGWFNATLFINVKKAYYLATPFYHYNRMNESSLVHGYYDNLVAQYKKQWNLFREIINTCSLAENFDEALKNRIACSCLDFSRNVLRNKKTIRESYRELSLVLRDSDIAGALDKCNLQKMSLKWRLYYSCCKYKLTYFVLLLTMIAEKLKYYLR